MGNASGRRKLRHAAAALSRRYGLPPARRRRRQPKAAAKERLVEFYQHNRARPHGELAAAMAHLRRPIAAREATSGCEGNSAEQSKF
jgi:hypothetical protein